ncbi:MAG: phosphate-starvation-inducible PsiE family protein [Thermodesulfobacteriota bacterium]|nr:phosphate-starvation-inducible PsiE family protein [Thermodesulfobacteriota bacterium]
MDDLYNPQDILIRRLREVIRYAVRVLAVMMTLTIAWGVLDVAWVLYKRLKAPPFMMLTISDILATFGAFMAVLIAIEIFININIYLRDDVIHVKIVMATALMAIARKVIIMDFKEIQPIYVLATAAVVLAMSIGYWLVVRETNDDERDSILKEMLPPHQEDTINEKKERKINT